MTVEVRKTKKQLAESIFFLTTCQPSEKTRGMAISIFHYPLFTFVKCFLQKMCYFQQ